MMQGVLLLYSFIFYVFNFLSGSLSLCSLNPPRRGGATKANPSSTIFFFLLKNHGLFQLSERYQQPEHGC